MVRRPPRNRALPVLAALLLVPALLLAPAPQSIPPVAAGQDDRALLDAARAGDRDAVARLLDGGVDVDVTDRYGQTAVFFAADRGHLAVVELLVERGAEVDLTETFYGMTPLGRALFNGNNDIAGVLLRAGASGAWQALGAAINTGDADLAAAAIAAGGFDRDQVALAIEQAGEENADNEGVIQVLEAALETAAEPGPPPEAEPVDQEALQRYVGRYWNEDSGLVLDVIATDVGIVLEGEDRREAMRPGQEGNFVNEEGNRFASFSGRGGMIERMALSGDGGIVVLTPLDPDTERAVAAAERASDDRAAGGEVGAVRADADRGDPIHWPGFRGPGASGIGDGQGVPVAWDAESGAGIRWKTPIPGIANSSPIVWGDRVFVATAISGAGDDTVRIGLYGDVAPVEDLSEHTWKVYALDRRGGEILWERTVHEGPPLVKRHTKSSQANSTPVTDGESVVAVFGSIGKLVCYDVDGNLRWERDIGALDSGWFLDPGYQWGHASSPVLYENTVIVQADIQQGSFIAAYDLDTGNEVWRTERDAIPTWGSPAIYRGAPRDEIITNGPVIRSYDPRTGAELWHLEPNSEVVVATPIVGPDLVYVTAGYPPIRPIYAIRPGGDGDISLPEGRDDNEHVVWSRDRGGTYIPSPILYRGLLYTNANNGRLTAYRADDGEMLYRARIGDSGGSYVASPVAADGRLYFSTEDGTVHVVRAGERYELLASNEMNEVIWATPAISDGTLIVRTLQHVWGIGE